MNKFFELIIKRKKTVIIFFAALAVVCGFLMLGVDQNRDMSKYLPNESESKIGVDILKEEYGFNGSAVALIEEKSIVEIIHIKSLVEQVDGIKQVIWLDDIADMKKPIETIDEEIRNNYYVEGSALLSIVFEEDNSSDKTRDAIEYINNNYGDEVFLSGDAINEYINYNNLQTEVLFGIAIALLLLIVILALATNAFFEVVLFLITIGVAIVLNMGTNIFFGEISYITFASAAILQLAVSMDYSIFLLHRFDHERQNEASPGKAMIKALGASKSSILSSGLTTVVGFLSLTFMSYRIGMDMGFVLAKGIVFSLICVMTLLPVLTVVFVKLIDKTKHRNLLPSLKKIEHALSGKVKYVIVGVLLLITLVGFLAQNSNDFTYSDALGSNDRQEEIDNKIAKKFGTSNYFVILVERGNGVKEYEMSNELSSLPYVDSIQGFYSMINPALPMDIVPDQVKENFFSENYSRYIVEVDTEVESEKSFEIVEQIRAIVSNNFENAYVLGETPTLYDIKETASGDFSKVTILSIAFVGIILMITFKSLVLPVILLFVIQSSIWINMSFPYFQGEPMVFIGYMIISAVQLGATIDYTILMTNYYLEGRKKLQIRQAVEYASEKAGASILVSAIVLAVAGFTVSFAFTQESMAQLGTLIGRGAILSGVMTIIVLPQILILMDKVIFKTRFNLKQLGRKVKDDRTCKGDENEK